MLLEKITTLPPWLKNILDIYQVQVFCVSGQDSFSYFFDACCGGDTAGSFFRKTNALTLFEELPCKNIIEYQFSLVMRCKISSVTLGQINGRASKKYPNGKTVYISELASISGALRQLKLDRKFGTLIGSLLMSCYTFLVSTYGCENIILDSSYEATKFYEKIGMENSPLRNNDYRYTKDLRLGIFPNESFYLRLQIPEEPGDVTSHSAALKIQRTFKAYSLRKLCQRIGDFVTVLKHHKESISQDAGKKLELCSIERVIELTQFPRRMEFYRGHQKMSPETAEIMRGAALLLNSGICSSFLDIALIKEIKETFDGHMK